MLTCHAGTWANSPTHFAYRWSRNGKQIRGADHARYRVRIADESTRLQCKVVASNVAGQGSATARGGGRLVAIAGTLHCPRPHGRLHGRSLGPLSLGMTRGRARAKFGRRFTVGHGRMDGFCLYGGWGIDAVYAPRGHLHNRIVLLVTSNTHYAMHKVRPGTSLRTARHRLKLGRRVHIGHAVWYVVRGRRADVVLQAGHGTVEQIGIATPSLARTSAAQRRLLRIAPRAIVEVRPSHHHK